MHVINMKNSITNNANLPLVSIIVPIYNMENSIANCVQSLIDQDYSNIEIILIDDGSQDNSLLQCKEIANKHTKVHVVHTENQGSGPARNIGISVAKGRYAYFPDADDFLEPNAISTLVKAISEVKNCDLVVFGYININTQGKILHTQCYTESIKNAKLLRDSYAQCMTTTSKWSIQGAPWNKFFDLQIIKDNHIEYPPLRRHQDECFIASYMCKVRNVHYISNILYTYVVNDCKKEWQKYPINYIESVIGLYNDRKTNILTWNPQDLLTRDMVNKEYICFVIKALELSFSPKMHLSYPKRKKWIDNTIRRTNILEQDLPSVLGWYQKIFIHLAKCNMTLAYFLLKCKVAYNQKK